MKSRSVIELTSVEFNHTAQSRVGIKLYRRLCDFCTVMTPMPRAAHLDVIAVDSRHRATLVRVVPSLHARTCEYDDYKNEYVYYPDGWELLGPQSWACPECVKKAEDALGTCT